MAKKTKTPAAPELPMDAAPADAPKKKKGKKEDDGPTLQVKERPRNPTPEGKKMLSQMKEKSRGVYDTILKDRAPKMKFPMRSLSNVTFNRKVGHFVMKGKQIERTMSVNTIKTFAQTLRMLALSRDLIETRDFATKRDAYYQTKNWGEAGCHDQSESDMIMDDLEGLFGVNKEQLGFRPDEHGGSVSGLLTVIETDSNTGRQNRIDCTQFIKGSYAIPSSVEDLEFESKAKFILCIETSGMFERLNEHKYWQTSKCILVSMQGVPSRSVRRFTRRVADKFKIPVYVFTDGDPYGYANIYRTLKVGSGNNAHLNEYFCVPQASYLGVTPDDIDRYKLPTHPLKEVDIKRARDALKNDSFFQEHKDWAKAVDKMLSKGQRVEQQALSKHGLNYVIDVYLPEKLQRPDSFLS